MKNAGLARAAIVPLALLMVTLASAARAEQLACETVERYRLPNGIEVVLQEDHGAPLAAVVSSVHAGMRNDPPGHAELAHYVEHLLFREGGPFPSAFSLYEGAGANVNATTTADTTNYQALLPSEQLERALWIEARRLGLGLNAVEEAAAAAEREVVLRELTQRGGEYQPQVTMRRAMLEALHESSVARPAIRRMVEDAWTLSEQLTQTDLDNAKRMLRTALLGDLTHNARFAERALWLARQGKSPDQVSATLDAVAQLDLERARDVARRWLTDNKPSMMVRASPQNLTAGLGLNVYVREMYMTRAPQAHKKVGAGGSAY